MTPSIAIEILVIFDQGVFEKPIDCLRLLFCKYSPFISRRFQALSAFHRGQNKQEVKNAADQWRRLTEIRDTGTVVYFLNVL